jgi:hypothetical protein
LEEGHGAERFVSRVENDSAEKTYRAGQSGGSMWF